MTSLRTLLSPVVGARALAVFTVLAAMLLTGCGDKQLDQALDTDALGYHCTQCKAKFYTERRVFPDICPQCKSFEITQVMGYVCKDDQHTTLGPRAHAMRCEKCGKPSNAISLPREVDLKAWGAAKKTQQEVSP